MRYSAPRHTPAIHQGLSVRRFMSNTLQTYVSAREGLLKQIVTALLSDERFVAAWLTGSFARSEPDAMSDLDLTVVVSDQFAEALCSRPWQTNARTTNERFDLFSRFGQPVVVHENNNNAPEGGTFTFVLYADSALIVDWVLLPVANAKRPSQARLLYDKVGVPVSSSVEPESLARRVERASERIAFFWMMVAVTAKYLFRQDAVFVQCWLETLNGIVREVERLASGEVAGYQRGSQSPLAVSREDQTKAIRQICGQMKELMPRVSELGGQVSPSPMPTIEILLSLANEN